MMLVQAGLLVVLIILLYVMYSRESYSPAPYPSDSLPYDASSDPLHYSGIGQVGYIGPDPSDIRVSLVTQALSQIRKGVGFVRVDSINVRKNTHTCQFVYVDDSTTPLAYQVTAVINMSDPANPSLLKLSINPTKIDITNGLTSQKYITDLSVPQHIQNVIIKAIQVKGKKETGKCLQFVTTNSLIAQGNTYVGTFTFLDISDFPVGVAVSATVSFDSKGMATVTSLTFQPDSVFTQGVEPFKGDAIDPYFPFVSYKTIEEAAAPDLTVLKTPMAQFNGSATNPPGF